MKKVRICDQPTTVEGGYEDGGTKWPSKSSILETPERKRYRHSVSFADSGLGSSLFGSPPTEQLGANTSSPTLRTPTTKANYSNGSESTPSPLRSFIHISSYSASFSSPELRCSPSSSNLRLSNPTNATGFRFSGASVSDNEFRVHGRPLSDVQHFTMPSSSRPINRFLELPASTSTNVSDENALEEGSADVTIPYSQPETPSKGFGVEMLERKIFEEDAFSTITTSTPLRDEEMCFPHLPIPTMNVDVYRVPEQANGPLESSICEPLHVGSIPSAEFLFSPNSAPKASPLESSPIVRSPLKSFPMQSAMAVDEIAPSLNDISKTQVEQQTATSQRKNSAMVHAFRSPKRRFKPFSKGWMKIACGGTDAQVKMTRLAHEFLNSRQSDQLIPTNLLSNDRLSN